MKAVLFLMLTLLINFSVFAAPGGGSGGSHGGPGSPGSHGPGGYKPSSAPAKPSSSSNSSSSSSSSSGGSSESVTHIGGYPTNKPDLSPYDEEPGVPYVNFRGQRIILSPYEPSVIKSSVKQKSEGVVKVTLHFNQSINPESLKSGNIFVDGNKLSGDIKLKFNKKAESFVFEVEKDEVKTVEIKNLTGLNGKTVESVKVEL